jgi:hypothetical protein
MKPRRCKSSTNLDIFLDFPTMKTHLADLLGVAMSTQVISTIIHFSRASPDSIFCSFLWEESKNW